MQTVLTDQICRTGCVFVFSEKKLLGFTKLPSNKQQPSSNSHEPSCLPVEHPPHSQRIL